MNLGVSIGLIALALFLSLSSLWGISRWYGPARWATSRNGSRRRRMMAPLWVLYLFILGSITGLEALSLIPTQPALFFAVYGGVLVSGMSVCKWFGKPDPFSKWIAIVSVGLTVISACMVIF